MIYINVEFEDGFILEKELDVFNGYMMFFDTLILKHGKIVSLEIQDC